MVKKAFLKHNDCNAVNLLRGDSFGGKVNKNSNLTLENKVFFGKIVTLSEFTVNLLFFSFVIYSLHLLLAWEVFHQNEEGNQEHKSL